MMPLTGTKVIEFAGLAPGPFAGMLLADFGADVIRIDRPDVSTSADILARGKRSLAISPKTARGRNIILDLIAQSDVLIDPFRPGVLERLGLGPETCLKRNPRLVYARLTGYRRTGPYANAAGHDINYLALSGVLAMLRPKGGTPYPPLNLLADFAGGGAICVVGILLALLERNRSGKGQVVEADMVSGTRYIASFPLLSSLPAAETPYFGRRPGDNVLDGAAPFYDVYKTKDGKYVSVGALEPKFYEELLSILKSTSPDTKQAPPHSGDQYDRSTWAALRAYFELAFMCKTQEDWTAIFLGSDACVAPVLEASEAGTDVPAVAPILSRSPARVMPDTQSIERQFLTSGIDTEDILKKDLGLSDQAISELNEVGVVNVKTPSRAAKL